jgi:gluconolactonase
VAVEILDEAMLGIAPPDRAAKQLGSGDGGPDGPAEGPVWIHEGGYLLFSDIHGRCAG